MTFNFSEIKKQNDMVEEKLQKLKKEYQKPQMSKEQLEELCNKMKEANMADKKEQNKKRMMRYTVAAAAIIGAFTIAPNTSATVAHAMGQIPIIGQLVDIVTFRNYEYDTDRNKADIEVSEIKLNEQMENTEVRENLEKTTAEINAEIQRITDELVEQFETHLKDEKGYQEIIVNSEVLATTQDYFTLKLSCYQGAGSGYQWNYFYTINLNSGERLQLKDIFNEGTDYITLISETIKEQMQAQMATDDEVSYWLNDEIEELNFKAITNETSFYLNEKDNVVISFNEGEVAPMYMGTVEFEIPAEVLSGIRK